jgi:hypothetical protein
MRDRRHNGRGVRVRWILAPFFGPIGDCADSAVDSQGRAQAEVNRIAGKIALKSDAAKGQAYFDRALTLARQQQAKSWELRAAMSMARLWRDQGKRDEARDLLAPVYGWFTEGFDTLDLKEAKVLLDELAAESAHLSGTPALRMPS